jgi:chromosome partitioning protein
MTAHVFVVGNEKGGCGKTTTSMHLIVGLLRLGFRVGSMDLDARQRSLTRYLENRWKLMAQKNISLPVPLHEVIVRSPFNLLEEAEADEIKRFSDAINKLREACDFVVIDCPGTDMFLSRAAHYYADTVITPMNDSFIDLDVLANVDGDSMKILRPSIYSEMLWEQKLEKAKRKGTSIDWIVMRNRLSMIDAKNKRKVGEILKALSKRIGFRIAPGFCERVIFRELFLKGLTVLDVLEEDTDVALSLSHVTARQEVRDLLMALNIDSVRDRMQEVQTLEGKAVSAVPKSRSRAAAVEPIAEAV